MRGKTNKEVVVTRIEGRFVVPAGTPVHKFGNSFVVSNVSDAVKAGMWLHDAIHRYLFIPNDAVTIEKGE